MNRNDPLISHRRGVPLAALIAVNFFASTGHAHASIFHGETLDSIANAIS